MNTEKNEHLGKKAKDIITGFEGTVIGFCQYITGCDQYGILPKATKSGDYKDAVWFDINRLEFKKGKKLEIKTESEKKEKVKGACGTAPRY